MPNLLEVANFAFYNTTVVLQYVFVHNPLDQFEIKDFIILYATLFNNLRLSVLNISLYLFVAFILCASLKIVDNKKSIYNYMNLKFSRDSIYTTLHNIVINQINEKKGQNYFPYIFNLFIYILVNNLIGMIPYSFASTSHFLLAFSLSFTIVLGCTLLGLYKNGLPLFALFVPVGCPLALLPLLVIIELISYLARNVSLGLRLAANILSGHMLLNILSGFTCNIMTTGKIFFILGLLPLIFIIAFSGLELTIAFIQAQVFVVLSCSYMKDALELH